MVGMGQKDYYVGNEALSKRGVLSLKYPIDPVTGDFDHLDSMPYIWEESIANQLGITTVDEVTMSLKVTNGEKEVIAYM